MNLEEYHKEWAEEFSQIYGGLDILGIDILVQEDGTEVFILFIFYLFIYFFYLFYLFFIFFTFL